MFRRNFVSIAIASVALILTSSAFGQPAKHRSTAKKPAASTTNPSKTTPPATVSGLGLPVKAGTNSNPNLKGPEEVGTKNAPRASSAKSKSFTNGGVTDEDAWGTGIIKSKSGKRSAAGAKPTTSANGVAKVGLNNAIGQGKSAKKPATNQYNPKEVGIDKVKGAALTTKKPVNHMEEESSERTKPKTGFAPSNPTTIGGGVANRSTTPQPSGALPASKTAIPGAATSGYEMKNVQVTNIKGKKPPAGYIGETEKNVARPRTTSAATTKKPKSYQEGDPDQPIIVGSVKAAAPPPAAGAQTHKSKKPPHFIGGSDDGQSIRRKKPGAKP